MKTKPPVRVIRDKERKVPEIHAKAESTADPNRWTTAVKSWVVDFQQRDRNESLPAFDSLFKDAPPEAAPTIETLSDIRQHEMEKNGNS